jgi:hypoxanthine phosphoribosyltransferase
MAKGMECEVLSWAQITRLVQRLAQAIRASGFEPDVIVAIARGGYVPARLLADALGVMALTSLRVVHYGAGAQRLRRARLVEPLRMAVAGRRVLVVDDVADSGATYRLARRHIARAQPAMLRTAALHYKIQSDFEPDYYAQTLSAWRWISYPWARLEDIGGFIARLRPPPCDAATARRRLAREFGLPVPRALVAQVLRQGRIKAGAARRATAPRAGAVRRASARTRSRRRTQR